MKFLTWAFALISLAGIAFFVVRPAPLITAKTASEPVTNSPKRATITPKVKAPSKPGEVSGARSYESARDREEREEGQEKVDATMAQAAEELTPERQRQMVESTMQRREPGYRALFESWNLEAATIDNLLEIIRERETQLREKSTNAYRERQARSSEYLKEKKDEGDFTELQISTLLGPNRFAELAKHEIQVQAEEIADLKQYFKDHPSK